MVGFRAGSGGVGVVGAAPDVTGCPSAGGRTLEMWGGVECTVNRVGDGWFDQLDRSGFRERCEADLERIAELGIRVLRVGVLWEQVTATGWEFPDRMLGAMRGLGIRPIVTLLHHGSGPQGTDLLDPEFGDKLAAFAGEVAQRYPWVMDWTPVNEPQTTGRFACLYGHWYPHRRDMASYMRALVNEIRGVVLAMRTIRETVPEARLVHTEDGGSIAATPGLREMREVYASRRWLGTDLLCGMVGREHRLWDFLLWHGLSEAEVLWFAENPSPPSVLGMNYYVTSDRLLDERTELYPPGLAGGDTGCERLVDIEAVRVASTELPGAGAVLREAWERYGLPVAITEAHLGCTPEEQVRWLAEVWRDAEAVRVDGVDVRAVTAWAVLGSYNWASLCTQNSGTYEPGVWDVADGIVRETRLTRLVRELACGERPTDEALAGVGWWRKGSRLTFPAYALEEQEAVGV